MLVFSQPKVFLRALRPIKQGEEVFIKYTDISNPRSVRRDHVKRGTELAARRVGEAQRYTERVLARPAAEADFPAPH